MQGLMLDTPDSKGVTFDEVAAVLVPQPTSTFTPLPHRDLIEMTFGQLQQTYPDCEIETLLGTAREGNQLFGVMTLQLDREDAGLSIGFRNSYDKSLSVGIVAGATVFVCSNMCFSGHGAGALKMLRKHTPKVWDDVRLALWKGIEGSREAFLGMTQDLDRFREIEITQDRGYEILGRAIGQKVITPTQANIAFGDWQTPRYTQFEDRNQYSLYNCVTEGLKRGALGERIRRHTGVHTFFDADFEPVLPPSEATSELEVYGGHGEVIPEA